MLSKQNFLVILALSASASSSAAIMQSNYGLIISSHYTANGYYFTNHGSIQALSSADINVTNISGSGSISSDSITIKCDTFNYTGTLSCNGSCVIFCKNKFDPQIFKRSGSGSFTIIITPYEFKRYTARNLCEKAESLLCADVLSLTEDSTSRKIQEIRTHAAIADINEKEIYSKIKEIVASRTKFHETRIDETRDPVALRNALIASSLGVAGFAATTALYKKRAQLQAYISKESLLLSSICTGFFSTAASIASLSQYYQWLNPRHKEKYEKFSWLSTKFDAAFAQPRVKEELVFKLQ